jgi:polyhydroxybutyrate depolymerase
MSGVAVVPGAPRAAAMIAAMRRLLPLLALAALAAAEDDDSLPPPPFQVGSADPGVTRGSATIGGISRSWSRFVPAKHDARRPCALLVVLHGGTGNGAGMERLTEHGFEHCAERDDGIILYPDGVGQNWNDDRVGVDSEAHRRNLDDVGFIREIIRRTAAETAIDPRRISATGISNGAMMCYRLARELGGTLAAIAPVAGLLPEGAERQAWSEPVSVLLIQGNQDPLMPFNGGDVGLTRTPRGRVLSMFDTVHFLVDQDHLPSDSKRVDPADADPQDGTTWRGDLYGAEKDAPAVLAFEVQGGGHTWPGGRQYLPEKLIGRTSRDVDACQLIWDFCKAHPKGEAAKK